MSHRADTRNSDGRTQHRSFLVLFRICLCLSLTQLLLLPNVIAFTDPFCVTPAVLQFDPTTVPTTYPSGIIEGPVAPQCGCPGSEAWATAYTRGQHASVALDDSEETDNVFLVSWQSDIFEEGDLQSRSIMVSRDRHQLI